MRPTRVALAETLLPAVPVGRAALAVYDKATAHAPDDDEGKMIEIVSRAEIGASRIRVRKSGGKSARPTLGVRRIADKSRKNASQRRPD